MSTSDCISSISLYGAERWVPAVLPEIGGNPRLARMAPALLRHTLDALLSPQPLKLLNFSGHAPHATSSGRRMSALKISNLQPHRRRCFYLAIHILRQTTRRKRAVLRWIVSLLHKLPVSFVKEHGCPDQPYQIDKSAPITQPSDLSLRRDSITLRHCFSEGIFIGTDAATRRIPSSVGESSFRD